MPSACGEQDHRIRTVKILRVTAATRRDTLLALASDAPPRSLRALAARLNGSASAAPDDSGVRRAAVLDAAFCAVLADLVTQGWKANVGEQDLELTPPNARAVDGETPSDVKLRIRTAMEALRAESLLEEPTAEFIRRMETRRIARRGRVSVLDLVDDGAALVERLRALRGLPRADLERGLQDLVRPRVQPVLVNARCEETDLPLTDIWRYFRLTWAVPYRSTPGRTFAFLIRNDARPRSPVMGIGALASPLAQLTRREEWIGWTLPALKLRLGGDAAWWPRQLAALRRTVAKAVAETRADDLLLAAAAIDAPLEDALLTISRGAGERRRAALQPIRSSLDGDRDDPFDSSPQPRGAPVEGAAVRRLPLLASGAPDWQAASEDQLFVRKRARVLAELLRAYRILAGAPEDGRDALLRLVRDEAFAHAVSVALRECRKAGLASRVLDLQVCGAIAPYGPLLAGKFVALAVASRELRDAYRARYSEQVSEIASQMAGREVRRSADYCAVSTTSLYGVASSQYNRLALTIPSGIGDVELRWRDLGRTLGFGTLHLSPSTIAALTAAIRAVYGGANVTYRFGEGASPTLRQVREGLELLVSDPNAVLKHEASRRVYGFAAAPAALDALCLNEDAALPAPTAEEIAAAWRRRWLAGRLSSDEVLTSAAALGPHSVQARLLARDAEDPQMGLF